MNNPFSISMPVSSLLVYLLNANVKIKEKSVHFLCLQMKKFKLAEDTASGKDLHQTSFSHGEDVRF